MVVAVIALVVFGPQRLPEIARQIGRALNEVKRHTDDLRSEFKGGLDSFTGDDDDDDETAKPDKPLVHKGTTNQGAAPGPGTVPVEDAVPTAEPGAEPIPALEPESPQPTNEEA
jgi:TatA/E family protein of Tat protein translocase